MINKVLKAIKEYEMLTKGDSVIVALSGGADSVALLLALILLSEEFELTVNACHINHNLRGEASDADERFCRELCEKSGIAITVCSVDVLGYAKKLKISTEHAARELRYQSLERVSQGKKLATAHTLSDSVETVIFNMARGTGLDGLCGISAMRGDIIRPLITVSRTEVERFLAEHSQGFVTDATNNDEYYSRNRIRHKVIPELLKINPSLEQSILKMTELNARDNAFLEKTTEKALADADLHKDGYDINSLLINDIAIRARAIVKILKKAKLPYDYARVSLVENALKNGGAVEISCNNFVRVQGKRLKITTKADYCLDEISVDLSDKEVKTICIFGKIVEIKSLTDREIKFFVNKQSKQFKNCVDCDKIENVLTFRTRRSGDVFSAFSRNNSKTLKKLMNEEGLTPAERENTVVAVGSEVVWVEGFGISQKVAMCADTKNAVMIKVLKGGDELC